MAQPLYNDANSSGSSDAATDMMEVLHGMMEIQQHQTKLLKDGLLTAQQMATTTLSRAATS